MRVLDDDLLTAFEARLQRVNAVVVEHWAAGLSDARIDELLAPVAIDLPNEARVWWGRHNGTVVGAPHAAIDIVPLRDAWSLEQSARALVDFDAMGDELYGMPETDKHLRLVGGPPMLFVDCNGPRDRPAPIYAQNDWTEKPQRVLESLGELITIWIALLDDGQFATNADGTWRRPRVGTVSPRLWWLGYG